MLNKLTDAITSRIERAQVLDGPGDALADAVAPVYTNPVVRHVAAGTPIGHPLHPLLVTVPIGAWTSALLFDALRRPEPARTLVGLGLLGYRAIAPLNRSESVG